MNFGAVLGNPALKTRLETMLRRNRMLHSFLITGPDGSGKHTLCSWLGAALECTSPNGPCLQCESCRKALAGTHPDILTIDSEKQTIPVEDVRQGCADAWIRPTEGPRRVVVIPRADALNPQGQNALLKTIEEPPDHCVFLLLSKNEQSLLPTVRSRCAELAMSPLSRQVLTEALKQRCPDASPQDIARACDRSDGYLGRALACLAAPEDTQAEALALAFAENNALAALDAASALEGSKREALTPILEQLLALLGQAQLLHTGIVSGSQAVREVAKNRTPREIADALAGIRTLLLWTRGNVGPAHIIGVLGVLLYRPGQYGPENSF